MANEHLNRPVAVPGDSDLTTHNRGVGVQAGTDLAANKVLKNTYMLLAATLAFASLTGGVAMALELKFMGFIPFFAIFMGLSFLISATANSAWGLLSIFLFTGFLGVQVGSAVGIYLALPNGSAVVTQAFGLTAFVFLGLSAYVVTTKADMSFLRGFVMVGCMLLLGMCLLYVGMILFGVSLPAPVSLAVSGFIVLLMSALILYQTSEIVHGGETNYILATTALFVTIYNLLMSLLHIFGVMGDD